MKKRNQVNLGEITVWTATGDGTDELSAGRLSKRSRKELETAAFAAVKRCEATVKERAKSYRPHSFPRGLPRHLD